MFFLPVSFCAIGVPASEHHRRQTVTISAFTTAAFTRRRTEGDAELAGTITAQTAQAFGRSKNCSKHPTSSSSAKITHNRHHVLHKHLPPPSSELRHFLRPAFPASRVQHVSDLHPKFALRPHHVWKYGRHPIEEIKKEER